MKSNGNTGLQHQLEALFKGSNETDISQALEPLGYVPTPAQIDENAVRQAAAAQAKKEAYDHATQILEVCELGNQLVMAHGFLKKETSLDDAKLLILEANAAGAGGDLVTAPNTHEGINPLIADARHRAEKHH